MSGISYEESCSASRVTLTLMVSWLYFSELYRDRIQNKKGVLEIVE